MQYAGNIVLMVFSAPLSIHFLVVIEEVRIDLLKEPRLLGYCLLHRDEPRTRDPVNPGARWPGMSEWQVEELQHLEGGSESVHIPVLVLFCNSSLQIGKFCQKLGNRI